MISFRPTLPQPRRSSPGLLLVLLLVVAGGCGGGADDGGGGSAASSSDIQLNDQASAKTKAAADKVVKATPDKNLRGRHVSYKTVCAQRGDPDAAGDVPPNMVKCHIEAFFDAKGNKLGG